MNATVLSIETVNAMFNNAAKTAIPTGAERLIIPAYGFSGGIATQREEWGANGPFMEDVIGLEFFNDKDQKTQVLKQKDGCLICYNAPGRKEAVEEYIEENPDTFETAEGISALISFIKEEMTLEGLTPDLYDTDVAFASNLQGAPSEITVGVLFAGVKKKEVLQVIEVPAGTEFGGATAGEKGAYIRKDSKGDVKMIQHAEFHNAYEFVTE